MNERTQLVKNLSDQLRKIVSRLPENINPEDHFYHDLNIDSLDLTEYVASVEQVYRIQISDEDWEQLSSINAVADYLVEQSVVNE